MTLVVDRGIPDGGDYQGAAGVRNYMQQFLEPWESLTIAAESIEEAGDKVLARVVQKGSGRGAACPSSSGTAMCGPSGATGRSG